MRLRWNKKGGLKAPLQPKSDALLDKKATRGQKCAHDHDTADNSHHNMLESKMSAGFETSLRDISKHKSNEELRDFASRLDPPPPQESKSKASWTSPIVASGTRTGWSRDEDSIMIKVESMKLVALAASFGTTSHPKSSLNPHWFHEPEESKSRSPNGAADAAYEDDEGQAGVEAAKEQLQSRDEVEKKTKTMQQEAASRQEAEPAVKEAESRENEVGELYTTHSLLSCSEDRELPHKYATVNTNLGLTSLHQVDQALKTLNRSLKQVLTNFGDPGQKDDGATAEQSLGIKTVDSFAVHPSRVSSCETGPQEKVQSAISSAVSSFDYAGDQESGILGSHSSEENLQSVLLKSVLSSFEGEEGTIKATVDMPREGTGFAGDVQTTPSLSQSLVPAPKYDGDLNPDSMAEYWARTTVLSILYPAVFTPRCRAPLDTSSALSSARSVIHSVQSKANTLDHEDVATAQKYLKSLSLSGIDERPTLNADIEAEVWIQSMLAPIFSKLATASGGCLEGSLDQPSTVTCDLCQDILAPHELEKNNRRKRFPCCAVTRRIHVHEYNVCNTCLLILTFPSTPATRVGRCPLCASWIRLRLYENREIIQNNMLVSTELEIQRVTASGRCGCCRKMTKALVDGDEICDSCFVSEKQPLWYKCHGCGRGQRISFPLYRYQASADKYSSVTWRCAGRCQAPTRWRIQSNQVMLIPLRDAPWQKDWKKEAEARVQMVRQLVTKQSAEDSTSCSIL